MTTALDGLIVAPLFVLAAGGAGALLALVRSPDWPDRHRERFRDATRTMRHRRRVYIRSDIQEHLYQTTGRQPAALPVDVDAWTDALLERWPDLAWSELVARLDAHLDNIDRLGDVPNAYRTSSIGRAPTSDESPFARDLPHRRHV